METLVLKAIANALEGIREELKRMNDNAEKYAEYDAMMQVRMTRTKEDVNYVCNQ